MEGVNQETLQLWATQLFYAFEYGIIALFVLGIFVTGMGVVFIVPAQQPQNSSSWLGRQVNPTMCFVMIIGGILFISAAAFLEFWIEALSGQSGAHDNPLHWGEPGNASQDELIRYIARMGLAIFGLFAVGKGILNLTKIGSQDPPKHPIGGTIGMFLLAAAFFVPDRVAEWLAGFLPMFNAVVSALSVNGF